MLKINRMRAIFQYLLCDVDGNGGSKLKTRETRTERRGKKLFNQFILFPDYGERKTVSSIFIVQQPLSSGNYFLSPGFRFTYEEARQKCIPRTVPLEFLELSNFYDRDSRARLARSYRFYLEKFGSPRARSTVKKLAIIIRMRAIICK